MTQLLVIGDATIDTQVMIDDASLECDLNNKNCKLCLNYAEKIPVTDNFQTIGGNGANVSVGTANLGINTSLVSSVGDDNNGELILSELKKQCVDTTLCDIDKSSPTRYSVVLNFRGERTILAYHNHRRYRWKQIPSFVNWIYYTGLSAGYEDLQTKLIDFLKKHPTVSLAYNPGSHQLAHPDRVAELLPYADILIVNKEEAEKILNTSIKKTKSISSLIHQLLQTGVGEVVITDGQDGAYSGNMDNVFHMASYPVKVTSKTGAGDAFSSGFLAAKMNGQDLAVCTQWGVANSCAVIQDIGAQKGLLDRKRLDAMIKKYKDIKPTSV